MEEQLVTQIINCNAVVHSVGFMRMAKGTNFHTTINIGKQAPDVDLHKVAKQLKAYYRIACIRVWLKPGEEVSGMDDDSWALCTCINPLPSNVVTKLGVSFQLPCKPVWLTPFWTTHCAQLLGLYGARREPQDLLPYMEPMRAS